MDSVAVRSAWLHSSRLAEGNSKKVTSVSSCNFLEKDKANMPKVLGNN